MKKLDLKIISQYVEENIGCFHQKRLERLEELKLSKVLTTKNPYLFKAKHVVTADEIIRSITNAFISSNEETIFGDWLEGLAIFVNNQVYGGHKAAIPGIDLEFELNDERVIVTIKSGPNWGNSSQKKQMKECFTTAKKIVRTSNSGIRVKAVLGCCYGKCRISDRGDYFEYRGQKFWEFISGNPELFIEIIEPLGARAKEKNEEFSQAYGKVINRFTRQFFDEYCASDDSIDWEKLVRFNSGY